MSGFRWKAEALAGPARQATIIGGAPLMVRLRLFDPPEQTWPYTRPDAFTDLRTTAARELAFELLAAAEHAERLSTTTEEPRRPR
jgi:hypothetical protein